MKALFVLLAPIPAIGTRQRMPRLEVSDITAPVTRSTGTSDSDVHAHYHWYGTVFSGLLMPDRYVIQSFQYRPGYVPQHVQAGTGSFDLPRAKRQLDQLN